MTKKKNITTFTSLQDLGKQLGSKTPKKKKYRKKNTTKARQTPAKKTSDRPEPAPVRITFEIDKSDARHLSELDQFTSFQAHLLYFTDLAYNVFLSALYEVMDKKNSKYKIHKRKNSRVLSPARKRKSKAQILSRKISAFHKYASKRQNINRRKATLKKALAAKTIDAGNADLIEVLDNTSYNFKKLILKSLKEKQYIEYKKWNQLTDDLQLLRLRRNKIVHKEDRKHYDDYKIIGILCKLLPEYFSGIICGKYVSARNRLHPAMTESFKTELSLIADREKTIKKNIKTALFSKPRDKQGGKRKARSASHKHARKQLHDYRGSIIEELKEQYPAQHKLRLSNYNQYKHFIGRQNIKDIKQWINSDELMFNDIKEVYFFSLNYNRIMRLEFLKLKKQLVNKLIREQQYTARELSGKNFNMILELNGPSLSLSRNKQQKIRKIRNAVLHNTLFFNIKKGKNAQQQITYFTLGEQLSLMAELYNSLGKRKARITLAEELEAECVKYQYSMVYDNNGKSPSRKIYKWTADLRKQYTAADKKNYFTIDKRKRIGLVFHEFEKQINSIRMQKTTNTS